MLVERLDNNNGVLALDNVASYSYDHRGYVYRADRESFCERLTGKKCRNVR